MKQIYVILSSAFLLMNLCACEKSMEFSVQTIYPSTTATAAELTEAETTGPTEAETTEATQPTTAAQRTDLHIEGITVQQMADYFGEVVLNAEYTTGNADATLVQKWNIPICYRILGTYTQQDMIVLEDLFAQLNAVPGFPGIYAAADNEVENLTIRFLNADDFRLEFSDFLQGEEADGAVQYWYDNETNNIHQARIGYRTDISQEIRDSVLIEEVINLLGISDTTLRSDSITYQYGSDVTELSDVDWAIIKLLYDPAIKCGMDAEQCLEIIEQLYH